MNTGYFERCGMGAAVIVATFEAFDMRLEHLFYVIGSKRPYCIAFLNKCTYSGVYAKNVH